MKFKEWFALAHPMVSRCSEQENHFYTYADLEEAWNASRGKLPLKPLSDIPESSPDEYGMYPEVTAGEVVNYAGSLFVCREDCWASCVLCHIPRESEICNKTRCAAYLRPVHGTEAYFQRATQGDLNEWIRKGGKL